MSVSRNLGSRPKLGGPYFEPKITGKLGGSQGGEGGRALGFWDLMQLRPSCKRTAASIRIKDMPGIENVRPYHTS